MPWTLIITGILFCISAIFLFQRNAFEENKSIKGALLLMLMGIILIGIGSAKNVGLIQ